MYYIWKQSEIATLIDKYINENLPIREIHSKFLPHLKPTQLSKKLTRLKLKREINPDSWSEDELSFLKEKYSTIENLEDLMVFLPKRNLQSINQKVHRLGLKRDNKVKRRNIYKNNLKNLLDGSLESFYWIGFIFADGCVEKDGSLGVEISKKDKNHLKKLVLFLGFGNHKISSRRNNVSFSKGDKNAIDILNEKYQLKPNKTYNPPNLNEVFKTMTDDQILSLIAGFIDGDGHNRKVSGGYQVTLENHKSWFDCYETIRDFIKRKFGVTFKNNLIRTNTRGYVVMCFSQKEIFLNIREFIYKNKLPVLDRKWKDLDS